MKRRHSLLCLSSLTLLSVACSPKDPVDETQDRPPVDLRLAVPAADPKYVDFVGPDLVFKPGEDHLLCTYATYSGEDAPHDLSESFQGKFGHHFALLKAKEPKPDGTVEDCSKPEDMAKFDLLSMPGFELPANHAFLLRKGSRIVMQSHYVNTSKDTILVRDILRFRRVDPASVKVWAAPYASYLEKFEVKPGETLTRSYNCAVPRPYKLMMTGGHMHEWGKKFVLSYAASPADTSKELYRVDEWMAHYRDAPPTLFMKQNPLDMPTGAVLKTECTWSNDTKEVLSHPHEMCTTFGILLGSNEPWVCKGVSN